MAIFASQLALGSAKPGGQTKRILCRDGGGGASQDPSMHQIE